MQPYDVEITLKAKVYGDGAIDVIDLVHNAFELPIPHLMHAEVHNVNITNSDE